MPRCWKPAAGDGVMPLRKRKEDEQDRYPVPELDTMSLHNILVLLPAYQEERKIGDIVRELKSLNLSVLVVDDGSADHTAERAEEAGAELLRLEHNHGKGLALHKGFEWADREGFDAVVTMDADGQHSPIDVLRFCDAYHRTGIPVLIGNRVCEWNRVPLLRRVTNRIMSQILNRRMKQYVHDTQNGFRLYQTDVVRMVIPKSQGFAAESEILLQLDRVGIRMGSVPIRVLYGKEKSHIRPLKDTRLFFEMLSQQGA